MRDFRGDSTQAGPQEGEENGSAGGVGENGGSGLRFSMRTGLGVGIATVAGVGFGPWAPGTWGSLVAVFAFGFLYGSVGLVFFLVGVAAVTLVGIWSSNVAETYFGRRDDGRIVIDEVAGQCISLSPILGFEADFFVGPGEQNFFWWLLVVTGFVSFRWFDIRKPRPVKWAEDEFEGGVGVMADDVVAGILGAIVVFLVGIAWVAGLSS